jgi:hypothetical protein
MHEKEVALADDGEFVKIHRNRSAASVLSFLSHVKAHMHSMQNQA